jgi:4-methyl-5(b-hydroxyethyl)-thiazole monophosphate biosynthesis
MNDTKKTALFIICDGVEELETIAPIDILRRGGIDVTLATAGETKTVVGKNDITIGTDISIDDLSEQIFDALVFPGGPGVFTLRKDARLPQIIQQHVAADKWIAAICAAPTLLNDQGLLDGRRHTSHFAVKDELPNSIEDEAVVTDGKIITSQGAGTAIEFGLKLVEVLTSKEDAAEVSSSICFSR